MITDSIDELAKIAGQLVKGQIDTNKIISDLQKIVGEVIERQNKLNNRLKQIEHSHGYEVSRN